MSKIDLIIYKAKLMDNIDFELLCEEFQVTDIERMKEQVSGDLDLIIEENLLENDDPQLDVDQFSKLVLGAGTKLVLEDMIADGLIEVNLDTEKMTNVYTLTDAGRELGRELGNELE